MVWVGMGWATQGCRVFWGATGARGRPRLSGRAGARSGRWAKVVSVRGPGLPQRRLKVVSAFGQGRQRDRPRSSKRWAKVVSVMGKGHLGVWGRGVEGRAQADGRGRGRAKGQGRRAGARSGVASWVSGHTAEWVVPAHAPGAGRSGAVHMRGGRSSGAHRGRRGAPRGNAAPPKERRLRSDRPHRPRVRASVAGWASQPGRLRRMGGG